MSELEKSMKSWKIYVDDTFTYVKPGFVRDVFNVLNKFYIKFTCEEEHNGKISFLDFLLMRSNRKLETVFGIETNNDVYLHWRSFAPIT